MNKNGFLSLFLILSLFLPLGLSFIQTIDKTALSYEICQENQTEKESEEKESYNELEVFVLSSYVIPLFFKADILEINTKKILYNNVNHEILTPPPQLG